MTADIIEIDLSLHRIFRLELDRHSFFESIQLNPTEAPLLANKEHYSTDLGFG